MLRPILALAALLLAAAAPASAAESFHASGVQIYACQPTAAAFAWHLQGPDATLTDAAGRPAIHHFAGPTWQATDGSAIVGALVAATPGAAGSIPWLVLRATTHRGAGRLGAVTYVVRSQTQGGVAPVAGCDKDHLGAQARVAYGATYTFFGGP